MNYNKLLDSMTKKDENLGCGTYLVAFLVPLQYSLHSLA